MSADAHPRIAREAKTVEAMIHLYCRERHEGNGKLCADCSELVTYARKRLDLCPFQEGKTPCAKCAVHCYQPAMRERIRTVMRYAGPRMLYRYPVLAIQHMLDRLRREPV